MSNPARKLCLALVCSLLITGPVVAQTKEDLGHPPQDPIPSFGGTCQAITDDGYDGTLGSMTCFTVPGADVIITGATVDVGINHTFVGDLTIKVQSPMGTISTMMSRPGTTEPDDLGTAPPFGDGSDMVETAPVTFDDGAATSAEDMGATEGIVCQDLGICDYFPFPDAGPGAGLSDFNGEMGIGDWMVCVGDSAGFDTGDLCTAAVNLQGPAPGPDVNTIDIPTMNTVGLVILFSILAGIGVWRLRRS